MHPQRGKCLTTHYFSFYCPYWQHSSHKNPFSDVEFSFGELIYQSCTGFHFFKAISSQTCLKKLLFLTIQRFHGCRFNFHDMNTPSATVDLISTCFMLHFRVICKKQRSFIYKLTCVLLKANQPTNITLAG